MSARPGVEITFNNVAPPAPRVPSYSGLNVLVDPRIAPDAWFVLSPAAVRELEREIAGGQRRRPGRWRRAAAKRARRRRRKGRAHAA